MVASGRLIVISRCHSTKNTDGPFTYRPAQISQTSSLYSTYGNFSMTRYTKSMCFVLMPFKKEFKNQWELAFTPAIEECDLYPWRGDDKTLGTNIIIRDITRCIHESSIIIADLTEKNPNVMYELGLAHAAKKPVIMLAQQREDIPFDVAHIRYLLYDVRDLRKLKNDLIEMIRNTLKMRTGEFPDLFPELKLHDPKDIRELEYLRDHAPKIEITATPDTADIFFNDKFIGVPPLTIRLNKKVERNTISASAIGFFEYHLDITNKDIERGNIEIRLERRSDNLSVISKRVPRWLRYRRRDPSNPVLMRAIAHYLHDLKENEESITEVDELLQVAPAWYSAYVLAAHVRWEIKPEEALEHLNRVIALRPDHYVGYYNLACFYAVSRNDFQTSINYLQKILEGQRLMKTYVSSEQNIDTDPDFNALKVDATYAQRFHSISDSLRQAGASSPAEKAV